MAKYSIIFEWPKYDSNHPNIHKTRTLYSFHEAVIFAVDELERLNDSHLPIDYYKIQSITEV
jgi:hypothetical protein